MTKPLNYILRHTIIVVGRQQPSFFSLFNKPKTEIFQTDRYKVTMSCHTPTEGVLKAIEFYKELPCLKNYGSWSSDLERL